MLFQSFFIKDALNIAPFVMEITLLHFRRGLPEGLFSTDFGGKYVRQNGFSNCADPLGVPTSAAQH
ncbi:hypothetical protein C6Y45_16385 [Alkalicoccus saliphilus]|uniref:Uncharacterized protein n=1 Tax=Alkalicoccus saliphilus TaxID=200989 RepID=A0A2T4U220_9BACI|nr:hypothetical protein C6Y45_16385 [Alkalicoccus saliphilus]